MNEWITTAADAMKNTPDVKLHTIRSAHIWLALYVLSSSWSLFEPHHEFWSASYMMLLVNQLLTRRLRVLRKPQNGGRGSRRKLYLKVTCGSAPCLLHTQTSEKKKFWFSSPESNRVTTVAFIQCQHLSGELPAIWAVFTNDTRICGVHMIRAMYACACVRACRDRCRRARLSVSSLLPTWRLSAPILSKPPSFKATARNARNKYDWLSTSRTPHRRSRRRTDRDGPWH